MAIDCAKLLLLAAAKIPLCFEAYGGDEDLSGHRARCPVALWILREFHKCSCHAHDL
jgi:hypothetical protein